MLDDLKYLHQRDASDCLGAAGRQWRQLTNNFSLSAQPHGTVAQIVYAGQGSCALAAELALAWLHCRLPVEIVRGYDVPAYVSSETLFVAASYSGNSPEVLSALTAAVAAGSQPVIISSGGQLIELAKSRGYAYILLPTVNPSRLGMLHLLRACVSVLESVPASGVQGAHANLMAAATKLKSASDTWLPTVPTKANLAKQIALEVLGKSVAVSSGPKLWPAAYSWKVGFNKNAKQLAWASQYPEYIHTELFGWDEQPVIKPYAVIELRSDIEAIEVQRSFKAVERVLSGRRPAPIVVCPQGDTVLEQLLWATVLGHYVTIYTGLACGIDPAGERLKNSFNQHMEAI